MEWYSVTRWYELRALGLSYGAGCGVSILITATRLSAPPRLAHYIMKRTGAVARGAQRRSTAPGSRPVDCLMTVSLYGVPSAETPIYTLL